MKTLLTIISAVFFLCACDNHLKVSFTVESSSVLETGGTASISLRLNRSIETGPSDVNAPGSSGNKEVRVPYSVKGTAQFNVHHKLASGTIVFPPRAQEVQIQIPILYQSQYYGDKTLVIDLEEPEGAAFGLIASHTLTIQEVDSAPALTFVSSLQDISEGAGTASLEVTLPNPSQADGIVELSFSGTATLGEDFSANTTFTIPAGQTTAFIPITILNDLTIESNETVIVTMSNPQGIMLGEPASTTLIIGDNDALPTVSLTASTQSVAESVGTVTVTVNMSKTYGLNVTIPFSISGTASLPEDHDLSVASITIPTGSLSGSFSFQVINDSLDEDNETIVLTMGTPNYANPGAVTVQTITITDNDPTPTVQLSSAAQTIVEGGGNITFRINLSVVSGRSVTVPFNVSGTASNPADHNLSSGSLIIPPGSTFVERTFTVLEDTAYEGDETIIVTLGTPTNATVSGVNVQTITVTENDEPPVISFQLSTQSVTEGNSGQKFVAIRASLSKVSAIATKVTFTVTGTASSGSDYSMTTVSPLTINPGSTLGTIGLNVLGDTMYEPDETLIVTMNTPTGATIGSPSVHTLTITNDEAFPIVSFNGSSGSVSEGAGVFILNALATTSHQSNIVIPYTVNGTASNPSDHSLSSGNLTIAAGSTLGTLNITLVNDAIAESSETVVITMGTPTNADLGSPSVFTLTIQDNDREFDLNHTVLWLDAEEKRPKHVLMENPCGFEDNPLDRFSSLFGGWRAFSVQSMPWQENVFLERSGLVLSVETNEKESFSKSVARMRSEFVQNCSDLKNVVSNPLLELFWFDPQESSENYLKIENYLKSKYAIEWSQ